MTRQDIETLLRDGETIRTEFKRDAPISETELAYAVACLANTEGGVVLIGVEDDGSVTGLHASRSSVRTESLEALIANRTRPALRVRAEIIEVQSRSIAIVHVARADHIVQTSDGRAPRRLIVGQGVPECQPMHTGEIASRLSYLGRFDYSDQRLPEARWEDFDPLELERIRQEIDRNPRSDKALLDRDDQELALALGMIVRSERRLLPTVGGILLAGRESAIRAFVPTHETAFQVLREDRSLSANEFMRHPLVRTFRRLEEMVEVRNDEQELMLGIQRIGVPRYPVAAVREAIANALIHRDYAVLNAVYVQLQSDRGLRVISPGGFVEGVSLDNLLVTGPRPRNRVLADAFKRLGLVDRSSRGVKLMFESVLGAGRGAPDYAGTDATAVQVTLPGGEADLAFVRLVVEAQDRQQRGLDWKQLLVLRRAVDVGELVRSEVEKLTQATEVEARALLNQLVEAGLLESKGPSRDRSYLPSAAVYKHFGKESAYVRRRGFDAVRNRQLVLSQLDVKGRIQRSDVIELCRINGSQADYLLRKLRQDGMIEFGETSPRRGSNVFYVRRES